MNILKIAAFSYQGRGGNPAGVVFSDQMPASEEMLKIAREVGYSETAFLVRQADGWRIRYFAPQREVPFCGHATIASGAALGERFGEGSYKLYLNEGEITVSAEKSANGIFTATLQSPETWSKDAPGEYVDQVLAAFKIHNDLLDPQFPIRFAFAGAKHLIVFVKDRQTLAEMSYPFDVVKSLMAEEDLITISILWRESDELFHSRNAFASGGVYEDPATGAGAAALAGYLRDINWQGKKEFKILQGEDMGTPSRLLVQYNSKPGESIKVSGEVRTISDSNMSKISEINESPSSKAIRNVRERFNEAIAKHAAESIGALLAPNYHIITGRSDQFHGAEEEALRWARVFEKDAKVIYRRTPREIRVNEEWGLAEELGNWVGKYSAENGIVNASGVYSAKWQRTENGEWLIQVEVFTTLECVAPAEGCVKPDPIVR